MPQKNGEIQLFLVMTPTLCRVAGCIMYNIVSIRPTYSYTHAHTYLLTYLHSWRCAYKTGNISEAVKDRATVTIDDLYIIVYGLSIAAQMYDLEWPLSEIQGHWFKCCKMTKYIFTVRRYAFHGICYSNSVCLSVRPSVCLSHSWTVSTWFDLRSWFLHHRVAPSF